MGLSGALLAMALLWLAGMLIVRPLLPRVLPRGGWLIVPGFGFLLAVFVSGALGGFMSGLPPAVTQSMTVGILVALAAVSQLLGRRRPAGAGWSDDARLSRGLGWATGALGVVVAINVVLMIGEITTRPLLGWDAWTVWAVKPLVWLSYSPAAVFTSPQAWLASSDPLVFTVPGFGYPEPIGRFQLLIAGIAGRWDDAIVYLPWAPLWALLLAAFVGFARLSRIAWGPIIVATALLACTPFLAVHGVLPGYMDLWIAFELLLAVGALSAWLQTRERGLLLLAVVPLVALPLTKLEGLIWSVLIAVSFVLATRPPGQVLRAMGVVAASAVVWRLGNGIGWEIGGAEIALRPDRITLPHLGTVALNYENRLPAFFRALFLLPNWHVLAGVGALGLTLYLKRRWLPIHLASGLLLLFSVLFLFVLFNFTTAASWAEDLTASNRLTMHIVPAGLWLLLRLYAEEPPERSAAPSDS